MQHELTSLLYLSEKKDFFVEETVTRLNKKITYKYLQNEDKLLNYVVKGVPSILLIEQQYFNRAVNVLKTNGNMGEFENILVILIGSEEFINHLDSLVFDVVTTPIDKKRLALTINNAHSQLVMKQEIFQLKHTLQLQSNELRELNNIGVALSAERDPDKLLNLILAKSRKITHADAGSLYLVEAKDDIPPKENDYFANKQLRFKLAHNDSVSVGFTEFLMPVEKKSIAGYVALSDQVLNIRDVYQLPPGCEFGHNSSFDESVGYCTRSALVIPMKTHKDEIIGVLQLINRKRNWDAIIDTQQTVDEQVIPFDEKCVELANSLASQAAISIENNRLYGEIKRLFDGFIRASVHAIEQRDPTTFGHSERVALLTTELAKTVDRKKTGKFKNIHFSREEIQTLNYAALLHDFGKIGVREDVLVKAKKLFPHELDEVKRRLELCKKDNGERLNRDELEFLLNEDDDFSRKISRAIETGTPQNKILNLVQEKPQKTLTRVELMNFKLQTYREKLNYFLETVIEANEPKILKDSSFKILAKIGKVTYDMNGRQEKLLTSSEIERLSIPKGSLSNEERMEIESHVTHTFNFLSRIPWTSELKNIPQYAYAHHEKLDGSGYPRKLKSNKIPIQSKMMAIADIYDALTAWDRPYKKAVPVEKALDILQWEANDGKIDADLFKLFLDDKIYDLVKKPEYG